jgi:hypothetical protein
MDNTQNTQMPPVENPMLSPDKGNHMGPIIGSIIIIILLVLGALYFWSKELNQNDAAPQDESAIQSGNATFNTSDEVASIEADLEATSFTEIEADLEALEQETE